MADFYLLPPRRAVGEEIARLLRPYLPGVRVTAADGVRVLEDLTGAQAFVVYADDLPAGEEDALAALRDGFGASAGDRVIRVEAGEPVG